MSSFQDLHHKSDNSMIFSHEKKGSHDESFFYICAGSVNQSCLSGRQWQAVSWVPAITNQTKMKKTRTDLRSKKRGRQTSHISNHMSIFNHRSQYSITIPKVHGCMARSLEMNPFHTKGVQNELCLHGNLPAISAICMAQARIAITEEI